MRTRSAFQGLRGLTARLRRRQLLVVVVASALLLGACDLLVETAPYVNWTDDQRAAHDSPGLAWDYGLATCADAWAEEIASTGEIAHSELGSCAGHGSFESLGEIIGAGPNPWYALDALVRSPGHMETMLSSQWRAFGIGVAERDGQVYLVWQFGG